MRCPGDLNKGWKVIYLLFLLSPVVSETESHCVA